MSVLGWLCVVVGALIILIRAPLIVWPAKTLDVYGKVLETDARLRALGCVVVALGLGLIVLAWKAATTESSLVFVLGWLFLLAGLWLLVFPASYRRLFESLMDVMTRSADPAVLRLVGLAGTAFGILLVYAGLRWL